MAEKTPKKEQIAADIIKLSRSLLMVNFRYMDRAVAHLPVVPMEKVSIATDGGALYYDPDFILYRFKKEKTGVTRDILHSLLHCVFLHMFVGPEVNRPLWDISCDIAVEYLITELGSPHLASGRTDFQTLTVRLLEEELPIVSAEQVYRWLREKAFSEEELETLRDAFRADNHSLWYGKKSSDVKDYPETDMRKIWEDISRRMQTETETMERDKDSVLVQSLRRLNRKKQDYTEFLAHFGSFGEVMHLSDEFDQNFYTYGLELYGNIPLIEPLEYSDQRRIRDFVIAIDTSGSVKGDLVQSFVQHTYDILRQKNSFHTRFRLLILQCDDAVRETKWIRSEEEFEDYIRHMEILGLGQTDFRPVFSYVNDLLEKKELQDLQGLLYFTDGDGIFPENAPAYETAFILPSDDADETKIPCWAMGVVVTEEDILRGRL